MDKQTIEVRLESMRLRLPERGVSAICWMGVTVSWQRLAKRDGGYIKRNGSYGKYVYEYRGAGISLEEAVAELMKPLIVRQVLAEADDIIKAGSQKRCGNCKQWEKVCKGNKALTENSVCIGWQPVRGREE